MYESILLGVVAIVRSTQQDWYLSVQSTSFVLCDHSGVQDCLLRCSCHTRVRHAVCVFFMQLTVQNTSIVFCGYWGVQECP